MSRTRRLQVRPADARISPHVAEAAEVIRSGGLVAFPTETVYGLGANALSEQAVRRIYEAKQRDLRDPCIVHVASLARATELAAQQSPQLEALARAFWPGPLSIIVKKSPAIPDIVTAGLSAVALRMPDHPVARALIEASDVPIAAPSANLFGHVSPTTADHVLADLDGRIDMVLDAGSSEVGIESTVIDVTRTPARILRPGAVTAEMLATVLGSVVGVPSREEPGGPDTSMPAPGLSQKHYAPDSEVVLFGGTRDHALASLREEALRLVKTGAVVAILVVDEDIADATLPDARVVSLGSQGNLPQVAHRLFATLRDLESDGVQFILTRTIGAEGIGAAIQDRLTRAAASKIRL